MRASTSTIVLRSLLGLILLIFGLNGFLQFMPTPPMPKRAAGFIGALVQSGYMMQLVSGTQVVVGSMLLAGVMVPLALVILAPLVVNIILFHIFLAPAGILPGLIVAVLELILAWQYRDAFAPLFSSNGRAEV